MKASAPGKPPARGASLIEAVVAVGVLAVAIPLVFGSLAESGKSGTSSQAETRSSWIVPACVEELQQSRAGISHFLPASAPGEAFPGGGDVWALGFSEEGRLLGKVLQSDYERGVKVLAGDPVRYIAHLTATAPEEPNAANPMLDLRISLEFPAASPAEQRQKLDFHSRIP